jgi:uroporphyrinogen III methyltransferase/synthase
MYKKVYLVGAGPGDLKLITLRGFELIQEADVIVYDYLVNKELLNYSKSDADLIYVGKQASKHELSQRDINSLMVEKAREGGIVVRLKGGDPFIFGRGGEEAEFLHERGIDFEIVPGVTSAISAPAYAGIPLTHRDYASSVAFITGHEDEKKGASTIRWDEFAQGPDTLVFLMGIKNLKEIKERLIKAGKDPQTPACIIQQGTLPEQKVVSGTLDEIDTLANEKGIKPPGIIIIGEVTNLRKKLKWFESKSLFGKKIVVTRPSLQSAKMGRLLSEKGAKAIYLPTIKIIPIEPNKPLLKSIDHIDRYCCIIFTSVNGVSLFFDRFFKRGKDIRALHGIKILPIGRTTASLLRSNGIIPDFIPEKFTSEGIIDVLKKMEIKGKTFLHPRAEEARDVIFEYIRNNGGSCDVVPVYKTALPEQPVPFTEKPDVVTFTSSSTADNFIKLYGKDILHNSLIASIGPITSKTLKKHNINVHITAKKYDLTGLIEAIEDYFKN